LKKSIAKIKFILLSIIKQPKEFLHFIKGILGEEIYTNEKHIRLAAEWLLKAQENGSDNGYSRGFYLYKSGWDKSYIETTGYIIPTMLEVYKVITNEKYLNSALKAGDWLVDIQNKNGSFSDIDNGIELVFDTGQVLYGLIALYESKLLSQNQKKDYYKAIENAASWLCSVQDKDGSWTKYGYQGISHTYYTRVAAILYKAGLVCNNEDFKRSADNFIAWTLKEQKENGFFKKLSFVKGEKPLLHAIIYVLEGLYDYYLLTDDQKVLEAVLKNAQILKDINLNRELLLCSQYDEDFNCVNGERCITGLAQWSNLAFKLYEKTRDEEYLICAKKSLYYLKAKQFKENNYLIGSLPGSVPFWGEYARFSAVNWGVKFFLDAMLEYHKFEEDLTTQSSLWVGECFKFSSKVVSKDFTSTGEKYKDFLSTYIKNSDSILDLDCGEGKYIRYFKDIYNDKNFVGIDPYFYDNDLVKKGDVYNINDNNAYNLIYTIEVLQHVKYIDRALKNIYKALDDNGFFIICDRNPKSIIGLLKPIYECTGKWMYPCDSPFKEKWYSTNEWRTILNNNGFEIVKIESFIGDVGRFGWMHRYSIIVAKKIKPDKR
jgi:ubiquinone/menaquinone biosynthesis C-methylase UbiE